MIRKQESEAGKTKVDMRTNSTTSKYAKGFISLLDGIVALMILLLFSTIIFSFLQKSPDINEVFIYHQGYDILTVLEYTNFSNPTSVFQNTGGSLCMRLEIYSGVASSLISTYYKTGCPENDENEKILWRTFINGQEFRTAKLAVWRKK
jgi:hypothetical protein